MDNDARIAKANDVKAVIDRTKPVTDWGMTSAVWTNLKGDVRVYVNDKKRLAAAILVIDQEGNVTPQWQAGHSMTRNELRAALGLQ